MFVFIAFGSMMAYMTYRCMNTPVNLVEKEYYKDELVYQDVIDGARKANALSSPVVLHQETAGIVMQLPQEMKHTQVRGSILFYCAADAARDRKVPMELDEAARQLISRKTVLPGAYTVKIEWESNHTKYYTEKPLSILQ